MAMLEDLKFFDERLEDQFEEELRVRKRQAVRGFGTFRFWLLVGVTLRVWQWVALAADVMQAAIGCLNHVHMAPSHEGIRPVGSLMYLSYGSTAMWIWMYTTFSFLPFWLELVKAAAVAVVLLAFNDRLCRDSPGLRQAYATIDALAQLALRRWLPAFFSAATDVASPPHHLCVQYQMHVVLLAFLASTWAVYRTERRMRLEFLLRFAEQENQQPGPARRSGSQLELAAAGVAAAAEEADAGPSAVSDLDFLVGFGIPAALGVLMMFAMDHGFAT
ncbi:expressed protein [Chlorella variabilis]|uniref:Expressed protein n=1 Tax=Chlorella variabilis TaxID=554065 RepID=E1Z4Z6_CHLVA|nr:expressed protein [Chlorella variabilis]EFN59432.1 expressed protein [Chlorella variabilis]|eukprot:XP_005851534.1 expressed protein [Chlorella variabilis]